MKDNEMLVVENYEKAISKCTTKDMVNKLYRQARVWTRFHTHFEFACTPDESREINAKFKEIRVKKLHELGYRTFGEIITSGKIFLEGIEYCGLIDLYEKVAKLSGYKVTEKTRFDCTKIDVSENVMKKVYDYYQKEKGATMYDCNMAWCMSGPKCDAALSDDLAVIREGFCYEST